ncbi:MAG TPA: hypothetical protein VM658_22500 [bacterium]|nr:hypothetical protein [bacterium]
MLKVTRAVAQLVRRVDVLEECTRLYRGILGLEQPVVRFGCISCRHDFDLPLAEAQALNFTPLCPECHNWALPFPKQEYFTAHQIAALAGFPYRTVLKMIHTRGFEKASKEPGAKHGKAPAYDETTVRELLMTLKESPAPYRSNRLQAVRNR